MDAWVQQEALAIARRAVRELEALVAVSSPSGDVHGAEECAALCAALLPAEAEIERPPCSSPDHAPDFLATLRGPGRRRILMLGHVDTVVSHVHHKPLRRDGERLVGSGAVDMKGGVVLAPDGPDHLTAVPTVMHAGEAFNIVPARGELSCDLRADTDAAILAVLGALPRDVDGVTLDPQLVRLWPGMSSEAATAPLLARAGAALGRPIVGVRRGGASDASHMASSIPVCVDGLGPRGGKAHNPDEFVFADSLGERAEVALALVDAALSG